jgi:hypothetical protein
MRFPGLNSLIATLEKIAPYPAFIIIIGWGLREAWTANYDVAALSIPLLLALAVLLEIRTQILRELPTRRVTNFGGTHPFIQDALDRQLRRRRPIEIRILGQTMQSYIAFLKPLLLDVARHSPELGMKITIAMIDPEMTHLGPGLPDAARAAIAELTSFSAEISSVHPKVSVVLFTYDSPPAITGIAINDACLFLGMIRYERKTIGLPTYEMATTTDSPLSETQAVKFEMVRAAGGSYDIYRDSQPEDEERITLFIGSFDALCLRSTRIL